MRERRRQEVVGFGGEKLLHPPSGELALEPGVWGAVRRTRAGVRLRLELKVERVERQATLERVVVERRFISAGDQTLVRQCQARLAGIGQVDITVVDRTELHALFALYQPGACGVPKDELRLRTPHRTAARWVPARERADLPVDLRRGG